MMCYTWAFSGDSCSDFKKMAPEGVRLDLKRSVPEIVTSYLVHAAFDYSK